MPFEDTNGSSGRDGDDEEQINEHVARAAPDPRGIEPGETVLSAAPLDPRGATSFNRGGEVALEQGPPPPAYASLPSVEHHPDPPDFRQRSLREFSLPRSATHGSHRSSRRSFSSNHQSQLRKQAHTSPSFTSQRSPSAGLPTRSLSSGAIGNSASNNNRALHGPSANGAIPPAALDIRPPLLDIPRAAYSGRAVSAPPPMEAAPEPEADVHSGWATVDVMEGEAGGVPPCERSLHAAAVLNGNLCVFGGCEYSY